MSEPSPSCESSPRDDLRAEQVKPLLVNSSGGYTPCSAADYIITFHWDKDGAKCPDADKEVDGKTIISNCFVFPEETQKVFTNLWKACGGNAGTQVKLSVLREAILADFQAWLPRIGFECSCFKSLDEDELFMRISLEAHEVQQFYAEQTLTPCQLSEETLKALNIEYPQGTPENERTPPYMHYEDKMDADQSKILGLSTIFFKNYKLQDTRGSLLRQVDRVRIIRKTIMRLIDLDDLVGEGIISGKFPVHILMPLEDFREEWATFTIPKLFGCFAEQPLLRIRNYFGEQVAFYFAWLSLTIQRLLWLGIIGVFWTLLTQLYILLHSHDGGCESWCLDLEPLEKCSMVLMDQCGGCVECEHLGIKGKIELGMQLGYGLVVAMWATAYRISWKRLEYKCTIEWDMQKSSERASLRADYRGEMKESPLNANEVMKQFPQNWITFYKTLTKVINIGFLCISVSAIFFTRGLENYFSRDLGLGTKGKTAVSVLIAVEIQVFNTIWQLLAYKLVELENPRTEADYANALIWKLAPFGLVTTYNTFVFIALMQHIASRSGISSPCPPNPVEHPEPGVTLHGDCIAYLQVSLFTTFATQAALIVVSMAIPFLTFWWALRKEAKAMEGKFAAQGLAVPERSFMEKQSKMGVYDQDAQITDYMSCITVLGYVLLFGAAVPSSAFIALLVLLFQYRANAYKLVRLCRRPYPVMCNGIGSWNQVIETLSWMGLIFYVGVPILNCHITEHLAIEQKLLLLFMAEHAIVLTKLITSSFLTLEAKGAKLLLERHNYVKDALLIGKDDPEALQVELMKKPAELTKDSVRTLNETSDEWGSVDQIGALVNPGALLCPCCVGKDPNEDDTVRDEGMLAEDREDFV